MALIAGLLTRLGSLGIASVMVVALATVHLPNGDPFVSRSGGHSYELASVYLACVVLFLALWDRGGSRSMRFCSERPRRLSRPGPDERRRSLLPPPHFPPTGSNARTHAGREVRCRFAAVS